ncbi:CvpA family protein [Lactonifactor longoviformis]|uniref:CvpA family protein n=1 Tax=Lactonifactor longoviformis TaxID=341220 RepID=UPI0036F3885D
MNWLSIVVLAFLIFTIINGFRRGLIRTVISMVSVVLAVILASFISPHVSEFLEEQTPVYDKIQEICETQMENYVTGGEEIDGDGEKQSSIIEELPLPESLKNSLLLNNTAEGYSQLVVGTFGEYLSVYIAHMLVKGIAAVLAFILAIILIRLLSFALESVAQLPVLSSINRVGGGLAGAVQGILIVWIFFLIITILCNFDFAWCREMHQLIQEDTFLNFWYNNNVLLHFMEGFLG